MRRCLAPSGRVPFRPPTKSDVVVGAKPLESHPNSTPVSIRPNCIPVNDSTDADGPSGVVAKVGISDEPPRPKRGPLHAIQLHPNIPNRQISEHSRHLGQSTAHESSYYTVLYTKRAPNKKRKNKTFQDGVLEGKADGSCLLYDLDGKITSRGKVKGCLGMPPGAELELGGWEIQVEEVLLEAQFRSGQCFLKPAAGPAVTSPEESLTGVKRTKLPRKPLGFGHANNAAPQAKTALHDPTEDNALILNREQWASCPAEVVPVVVDPYIRRHLRPHQQQGVQFLYSCVTGLVEANRFGAILADEMGLGKTIQILALVWTLLRQGPQGRPFIRKAIIVSPSSLIQNFQKEARRWLGDERMKVLVLNPGAGAAEQVNDFKHGSVWPVLAVSYETIRKFSKDLAGSCDLLICDEGHRLKSAGGNKTMDALLALRCDRRIILTGTPMQNNLEEYYAMISFVCPDLLGPLGTFKRVFADPVARANERDVSAEEAAIGLERSTELARRVEPFVLRRTAEVNAAYLPPLTSYVVFCRLSSLQEDLYRRLLRSTAVTSLLGNSGQMSTVLPALSALRKVCNHPDLLHVTPKGEQAISDMLSEAQKLFPQGYLKQGDAAVCGKLTCLQELLATLIGVEKDRVVIASQSTAALDIISALCARKGYRTARIDGSTDSSKRHDIVSAFNSGSIAEVCLLSTRAGGAGLNLIGANRLVLYDPDWNPAMDLQAMARVWRDGQQKHSFVYRLLSTGTVEEKIYQRQLMKGDLASVVNSSNGSSKAAFTKDELRELFTLKSGTCSDTRDLMLSGQHAEAWKEDMSNAVDDMPLKAAVATGVVSFVHMSNQKTPLETLSVDKSDPGQETSCTASVPLPISLCDAKGAIEGSAPAQVQSFVGSRGPPEMAEDLGATPCLQPVPACDTVDCLELDFED